VKRDIKVNMTVPEYYRKLGDEILTLSTVDYTMGYRKLLRKQHYEYADKIEKEGMESLKVYKQRNYKRGRKV